MFCRAMAIGPLGSRNAYALKEPYLLVYLIALKKALFDLSTSSLKSACRAVLWGSLKQLYFFLKKLSFRQRKFFRKFLTIFFFFLQK